MKFLRISDMKRHIVLRFILSSLIVGIVFGILDGLIHVNPIAENLYNVYKPITSDAVNVMARVIIDVVYGFILCGVFLLLYGSLPGSGFVKGIAYGILIWIFRVIMYALTQWMMFTVPFSTILYIIISGLIEMLIIGGLIGLLIKKQKALGDEN